MMGCLLVLAPAMLAAQATPAKATAELKNAQGQVVGNAMLMEGSNGVVIHATFMGLAPGAHAFHVHSAGTCDAPFTSAGAHFNPATKQHGIANPAGMHVGDMPNIQVGADGKAAVEAFVVGATLGTGANGLMKPGGTALLLHQNADDYKTDPGGDAGARIACGVVKTG